ncbi:MAG: XdhC family protein, partial [Desulfobacterales bacterium]
MICGGTLEVLIEHIAPTAGNIRLFSELLADWDAGNGRVLFTVFREDPPEAHELCRTREPSRFPAVLSEALQREMRNRVGRTRLPFVERENDFIVVAEPMRAPGRLFIAGAGHVGRATAVLAGFVGFDIIVLDDRPDFLSRQLFPGNCRLKTVAGFADCFDGFDLRADSLVVIVTRGHLHDKTVLAQALCTRAGYVGMIGSRRKRDAIYAQLHDEGFSRLDLERVSCPIGVD